MRVRAEHSTIETHAVCRRVSVCILYMYSVYVQWQANTRENRMASTVK